MTKSERKTFDEKSEKADRKRIESLINMKNTYNQQKKAVQQSLSNFVSKSFSYRKFVKLPSNGS